MKKKPAPRDFDGLRKKAEKVLADEEKGTKNSHNELQRTVHELLVHQIELEMQNDELRSAQEELSVLKEKYADLYDFAPVGYFTLDRLGKILDLNMTGYNLFRSKEVLDKVLDKSKEALDKSKEVLDKSKEVAVFTPKNSFKGKSLSAFVDAADRQIFAAHLKDVFEKGTLQKCELRLRDPGRHVFHAQLQSFAFGSEKELHCRTVITDISELQRLREERESYIRDLESFGTAASHELRGPLISVSRFSQVLALDYGECLGEEGKKIAEILADKAIQMEKLLGSLLEFSKISTVRIRKHDIRMNELIDRICRELAGDKEQRIHIEIKPVPHARGDMHMISRALTNLIANALKYSARNAKPAIEIGGYVKDGETVYYVKDNGVGFEPKYSFKLFDLFQRLHSSKDFPGTGTGLYIVRRIAEKHGGRVWAESKPGEGATFYFALPVE